MRSRRSAALRHALLAKLTLSAKIQTELPVTRMTAMKKFIYPLVGSLLLVASTQAKIIVVNTANNTSPGVGETNLVRAISLLQDGDTIQFNIPGSPNAVVYIPTPV